MHLEPMSPLARAVPARRWPTFAGLGVLLVAASFAAAQDKPSETEDGIRFKVIVHADNPAAELPADITAKLFRKKIKRWDHGVSVTPVDLDPKSPIRRAFTRRIHRKSVTAIESYWQRMIFSAREIPPKELPTDAEVISFVSEDPGAIGYVSAETRLADGTRELQVTY